jgi:uncharacterized membrane protein
MTGRETARVERLLARLLHYGTWLASAVIALGLVSSGFEGQAGMKVVTLGIALFILLPVARLVMMAAVFLREGDYRFGLISILVLAIVGLGLARGLSSLS